MTASLGLWAVNHDNQPLFFCIPHRYNLPLLLLVHVCFHFVSLHDPDIPGLGRTAALHFIRYVLGTKKQCCDNSGVINMCRKWKGERLTGITHALWPILLHREGHLAQTANPVSYGICYRRMLWQQCRTSNKRILGDCPKTHRPWRWSHECKGRLSGGTSRESPAEPTGALFVAPSIRDMKTMSATSDNRPKKLDSQSRGYFHDRYHCNIKRIRDT